MIRVAIVGAQGTGKTTLCRQLAASLADLVVAETTAQAVAAGAQAYDAILLAGLDVGCVGDVAQREEEDQRMRSVLQGAGVAFQVVYGQGEERLRSALQALGAAGVLPSGSRESPGSQERGRPWVWVCDKCSDPACEHRLFAQVRDARR